jgi:hypothetical protein
MEQFNLARIPRGDVALNVHGRMAGLASNPGRLRFQTQPFCSR